MKDPTPPNPASAAEQPETSSHEVTRLLQDMADGRPGAADRLARLVYDDLRAVASRHMRHEQEHVTLQTTMLVNDAFMRLVDQRSVAWQSRQQFFMLASQAMRRILVDYARKRRAGKRDGGVQVMLEALPAPEAQVDVMALDDALTALAQVNARHAQMVELRFFAGLSIEATAEALAVSPATVNRDWAFARAYLQKAMSGAP